MYGVKRKKLSITAFSKHFYAMKSLVNSINLQKKTWPSHQKNNKIQRFIKYTICKNSLNCIFRI